MFCDRCGVQANASAQFCSACGAALVPTPVALTLPRNRLDRHRSVLGILWLVYAALRLGGVIFLVVLGKVLPSFLSQIPGIPDWLHIGRFAALGIALGVILGGISAIGALLAGWGLLERASWAGILAIVMGCLALIRIPFGTALGIYTLWVLLPAETK